MGRYTATIGAGPLKPSACSALALTTTVLGGAGTDVCIGGPGTDTFANCETQIQ